MTHLVPLIQTNEDSSRIFAAKTNEREREVASELGFTVKVFELWVTGITLEFNFQPHYTLSTTHL